MEVQTLNITDSSQGSNNTSRPKNYANDIKMASGDTNGPQDKWLRLEFAVNMVNHMFIGFVTIYLTWMCISFKMKSTALHAWLCTIGFNFLMAEAMMTHYNGNLLLFYYSRKTKTTIHWVLQALGGALGIAGGVVEICLKSTHFTTIHGKVGLSAMIICGVNMLSGLSALYSQNLKRILQPLLNKTLHNFLGIAGFVLAMVAQYYGYETGYFKPSFQTMMEVIAILTIIFSCWGPLKALWEKCRNIKDNF